MAKLTNFLSILFMLILTINFAPSLIKTLKQYYHRYTTKTSQVGIIPIRDEITNPSCCARTLKKYFKDPEIKAIILRINSPGGSASAAQAIIAEIKELRQKYPKTIITLAENICTSGAYYVASATDYIIAQPSTLVGSIGTVITFPILKELLEQYHIQVPTITAGDYKAAGNPFTALTPEQHAMLQDIAQETYRQFMRDVAERRPKLSPTATDVWANGKVFTGEKALELGLIDELGYMSTLEKALRAKAPIEGEIDWIYPPHPSLVNRILGDDACDDEDSTIFMASSWLTRCIQAITSTLTTTRVQ